MAASLAQPALAGSHPFSASQWQEVQRLLTQLDSHQAIWLSGYLAGRERREAPPAAPPPALGATLLIGFGSETGNGRQLARQLAERAAAAGIAAEVQDLARLKLRQLSRYSLLALICSTHGDGDPPEPMAAFYDALHQDNAPRLPELRFAVLALGDSTYEHFCATGRQVDARLEALGGQRLLPRTDCDVDFAEPAQAWMQQLLPLLPHMQQRSPEALTLVGHSPTGMDEPAEAAGWSRQRPLSAELLENIRLSGADDPAPVHHLELALDVADFIVEPGDAVGVLAHNPPALVAAILDATGLPAEQPVMVEGTALPLVEVLRELRDLTIPSPRFLEYWAELSSAPLLTGLVTGDKGAQRQFLREQQLRDLITRFPARAEAQPFVDALRPLQPRLYDVANSLDCVADELHLTVKHYEYPFADRLESGIASAYLLGLQPGETVAIYPHVNKRFQLPEQQDAPLILIGDGTGAAPYRAFVQALSLRSQHPDCWLVFGEHSFEQDFFYQLDWLQGREAGVLTRIDTVFSGDQPGRELADPLLEQGEQLRDWLARGAHLYLCGDKARLTRCEQRLQSWLDDEDVASEWRALDKARRIHRNLY